MKIDNTLNVALKDIQTTLNNGTRVESKIDGVIKRPTVTHVDNRGRLFEIYNGINDGFWIDPVVYCYMFSIKNNQTKGWGLHLSKNDRYTLINGEMMTVLYDAREDSPTHKSIQKVFLSAQGDSQLLIPAGVWHMNINISESETFLINHPTDVYVHEAPDRYLLPFDTEDIPFDIKEIFPKQYNV